MTTLTREVVERQLDALVKEFGAGYVYPSWNTGPCKYEKGGEPSCIVGHVLNRVGVPVETLSILDGSWVQNSEDEHDTREIVGLQEYEVEAQLVTDDSYPTANKFVSFPQAAGIEIEPEARVLLALAQKNQDDGVAWGEAVRRARQGLSTPNDEQY